MRSVHDTIKVDTLTSDSSAIAVNCHLTLQNGAILKTDRIQSSDAPIPVLLEDNLSVTGTTRTNQIESYDNNGSNRVALPIGLNTNRLATHNTGNIAVTDHVILDASKYVMSDIMLTDNLNGRATTNVSTASDITINDNKKLKTRYIEHPTSSGSTVDCLSPFATPIVTTNVIQKSDNTTPIIVGAKLQISEASWLKVDSIANTTGSHIQTSKLHAQGMTLDGSNRSIDVDMAQTQSIKLLTPTQTDATTTKQVVYDPADNKLKIRPTTNDNATYRALVDYFNFVKLDIIPYSTIVQPTIPAELTNIIRFLVPSAYDYLAETIPGFSPTVTTTFQNGTIISDSGVWKVRGTDLDKVIAHNIAPQASLNTGIILSIPAAPSYAIAYSLMKPFFMRCDNATEGFRFRVKFSPTQSTSGKITIGLVSPQDSIDRNPFIESGYTTLTRFHNSMFLDYDPSISPPLRFIINKTSGITYSQQTFNVTGITVVPGKLIDYQGEWNPTLGKYRFTVAHDNQTYDSNASVLAADMPDQLTYMPFISVKRNASTEHGLWLNSVICESLLY